MLVKPPSVDKDEPSIIRTQLNVSGIPRRRGVAAPHLASSCLDDQNLAIENDPGELHQLISRKSI
jgi:hypothetical protein